MEDKKIEIDLSSGEALSAVKKKPEFEVFAAIKTKLVIVSIFFFGLFLFLVTTGNKSINIESESAYLPVEEDYSAAIDDELVLGIKDMESVDLQKTTNQYINYYNSYNEAFKKDYDDLRKGYISILTFSANSERMFRKSYSDVETFGKFENSYREAGLEDSYVYVYSCLANVANYTNTAKGLNSEREIKELMTKYQEAEETLESKNYYNREE